MLRGSVFSLVSLTGGFRSWPHVPTHLSRGRDGIQDQLRIPLRRPSLFDGTWARLLKRVFDIDIEHCPNCGGALKIIAAIEDPPVIIKILSHLGLSTRAPPRAPARRVDLSR